jgi:acyl-CoA synthetase (AMP-forming)/AMP-acid ligase II
VDSAAPRYRLAEQLRDLEPLRRTAVAFTMDGVDLSFSELDERADRFAAGARSVGLIPGDRVLLLTRNSIEIFEMLLGCARAGLALVPVNWRLSDEELAGVSVDCAARCLIVGAEFEARAHVLRSLGIGSLLTLTLGDGPSGYEQWLANNAVSEPLSIPAPDDVVMQIYTSGTSGAPKGVLITNANIAAKVVPVRAAWGMNSTSVSLLATPLFHMGALSWGLVSLYSEAKTIIASSASARVLLDHIAVDRVTHSFLVPTMLSRMCDEAKPGDDFSSLQSIAYGASPITLKTQQASMRILKCNLFQLYGLTETTGGISQLDAADHGDDVEYLLRSAGKPYQWVELEIRGEDGSSMPPGVVGEICTRSAQNTIGYYGRPAETAQLLDPDGWLHTGDAGHLDLNGYLFITDRIKDMIITGGENVYPIEVETVLRRHPAIADVSVIGLPDPQWVEAVIAVVVLTDESAAVEAEIAAYAAQHIAGYKCPRRFVFVDELPRNATGKVLKRVLRDRYSQENSKETAR